MSKETLLPFNDKATCPKCGHEDVKVGYCSGNYRCEHWSMPWDRQEHFRRICQRCHFGWNESVKE